MKNIKLKNSPTFLITDETWEMLSDAAWAAREHSVIFGKTKVGAAVLADEQHIFIGCNIQHMLRSHDIHAEISAISNMVSSGAKRLDAILVAAKRDKFTPCGSCLDWIMQFGGKKCVVGYQSKQSGEIISFTAEQLMPHYPE